MTHTQGESKRSYESSEAKFSACVGGFLKVNSALFSGEKKRLKIQETIKSNIKIILKG